jgi:hypothetical protein
MRPPVSDTQPRLKSGEKHHRTEPERPFLQNGLQSMDWATGLLSGGREHGAP